MSARVRRTGAAILVVAALGACERDREEPDLGVRVEDVLERPDQHRGRAVSIAGEVDEVFSVRVFAVGGPEFSGERLLIASRAPPSGAPATDDIVYATGVVQRITIVELERSWSINLVPEVELEFSGRPILVARSVLVSHRSGPRERLEEPEVSELFGD